MHARQLLLLALLLLGVMEAHAAPPVIWTGKSGGYVWVWSANDVTASPHGARKPVLSLRQELETGELGSTYTRRSVTVLSVVGPLISVQVHDYWEGGAHPSGETWRQTFDARSPTRKRTLTDYVPYQSLRKPLFADKVVGGILKRKGLKAAPSTSARLEKLLSSETFQVGNIEHRFGEHALSEFSIHHLEGDRVAIRLNVSWSYEAYRFFTTEIGLLADTPPSLKNWLTKASSGQEGFLGRNGARRFRDKSSILWEWKTPGQ